MYNIVERVFYFLIASGLLTWLIRNIFKLYFNKDIEKYKNELNKHFETYKTLHSERVNVIKNIYKKIERTHRILESLIKPLQSAAELSQEEKQKIFAQNFNDLSEYYGENRIFFQEEIAQEIDSIIKQYHEVWRHWGFVNALREDEKKSTKEWGRAWDKLKENVPDTKKKLERSFRELMGVE